MAQSPHAEIQAQYADYERVKELYPSVHMLRHESSQGVLDPKTEDSSVLKLRGHGPFVVVWRDRGGVGLT
jgi:hypothetical protein